jgi:two-component system, OmpR family, phosphate regulon sensor histidine kinase PhoR
VEQRTLLRELLDETSEPLLALDEHGLIVEANKAAASALGHQVQYVRGKPLAALLDISSRRFFREALRDALESGRAETAVSATKRPDGVLALRLRLLDGSPPSIVVRVVRDGQAVASELPVPVPTTGTAELLRLPTAIVGVRQDGSVAFANPLARRIFHEPLGTHSPLPPLAPGVSLDRLVERMFSQSAPVPAQLLELPDGRYLRVSGVRRQDGSSGVILIEDLTRELRSVKMHHDFVRNAAHQLRTPLAGIANAIEVLQAGAKENATERDRFLEHIERETHRLTRLAGALLVLARAQSGMQMPRLEFVELQPLLRGLVEGRRPVAEDVSVEVDCPARLMALADADLVEQALAVLVDNALRHTREGSIVLRAYEDGGRKVAIEVRDTGGGILPELQQAVFQPFFRAHHDDRGFGLGLSIAAQAIDVMDGTLELESTPGVGTTFVIRLASAKVLKR